MLNGVLAMMLIMVGVPYFVDHNMLIYFNISTQPITGVYDSAGQVINIIGYITHHFIYSFVIHLVVDHFASHHHFLCRAFFLGLFLHLFLSSSSLPHLLFSIVLIVFIIIIIIIIIYH